MPRVYIYVIDRDFGFAPNPFHGVCSLATCKPVIRRTAKVGDWVVGVGGTRLGATGRCVFAMRISTAVTFDEYWSDPMYRVKRPVRNGSRVTMVGDNVYHRDDPESPWAQEDSHHSHPDGSTNTANLERDTGTNRVLLSRHYCYFGSAAPEIPQHTLDALSYRNCRSHRVYEQAAAQPLLDWLLAEFGSCVNQVLADPFDFEESEKRYAGSSSRIA